MSEVNLDYYDAVAGREPPEGGGRGRGRRKERRRARKAQKAAEKAALKAEKKARKKARKARKRGDEYVLDDIVANDVKVAGGRDGGHDVETKKKRRGFLAPFLVVVLLLGGLGGGGYYGYRKLQEYVFPPDYLGQGRGQVSVQVRQGDSAISIGNRLHRAAVIKSARAFVKAAQSNPQAAGIQPGFYQLRRRMSAQSALTLLLDPSSVADTRITIPEGYRAVQIFQALSRKTGISQREFQRAATNSGNLGLPSYANGNVEGYLYPATYDLDPNARAADILKMMIDRFKKVAIDIDLEQRAEEAGISPGRMLTLASLAQAESGRPGDMPKVSRVVYNRLRKDMKLEFDSTVMYALNKFGIVASNKDLQVNSPYNTYKFKKLPPAPIANPGRHALEAAFRPASGTWIYFVTTNPERRITKFTSSYKTFLKYKAELQRNLKNSGG